MSEFGISYQWKVSANFYVESVTYNKRTTFKEVMKVFDRRINSKQFFFSGYALSWRNLVVEILNKVNSIKVEPAKDKEDDSIQGLLVSVCLLELIWFGNHV